MPTAIQVILLLIVSLLSSPAGAEFLPVGPLPILMRVACSATPVAVSAGTQSRWQSLASNIRKLRKRTSSGAANLGGISRASAAPAAAPPVVNIEVPIVAEALVEIKSLKGDFSLNGGVAISASSQHLAAAISEYSKCLPVKVMDKPILGVHCEAWITGLLNPAVELEDSDARISIKVVVELKKCPMIPNSATLDVSLRIRAEIIDEKRNLHLKVISPAAGKRPTINSNSIPFIWMPFVNSKDMETTIQTKADELLRLAALPKRPTYKGIDATYQGVSFNEPQRCGQQKKTKSAGSAEGADICLLVRADAHIDGETATSLISSFGWPGKDNHCFKFSMLEVCRP